jgi:hypothetical protein
MKKLLLVVLAVFMILSLAAGCAGAMTQESSDGDYYGKGEIAEAPAAPEESVEASSDSGAGSDINFDESILQPGVNRKIIYEGSISARTKKYDDDLNTIMSKLKEYGGYQENASTSGTKPESWQDEGRSATLVLRVPSAHFDDFMNLLKGLGETVSTQVNGRDVSEDYYDTESRLKTLRIQQGRLEDLLKQAATLEDIIQIENAIEETTSRIDELEIQLRDYDSLIDYSTVTVYLTEVNSLQEVKPSEEPLGERIAAAFYGVLNALAKFGEGLAIFFVGGSPILVPLIIAGVVLLIIFNRRKKKKAAMKNNQPPTM